MPPYDADFIKEMRRLNAWWDRGTYEWVVDIGLIDNVRAAMYESYGFDDETENFVDIWIAIPQNEQIVSRSSPIISIWRNSYRQWQHIALKRFRDPFLAEKAEHEKKGISFPKVKPSR